MYKHIFLVLILLFLTTGVFCGCRSSIDTLQENIQDVSQENVRENATPTEAEEEQPFSGEIISEEEFYKNAETNQIKVRMVEQSMSGRVISDRYSFEFGALSAYNAEAEASVMFDGRNIRMLSPNITLGPECLETRKISDKRDHKFVLETITQAEYKPFNGNTDGYVTARLGIFIENENGTTETYIINEEYYVLHFEGSMDLFSVTLSQVTEISTAPITEMQYMGLMALSSRYMYCKRFWNEDWFRIDNFTYMETNDPDLLFAEAFEHLKMELEYDGKSRVIEQKEEFIEIMKLFYPNLLMEYDPIWWMAEESAGDFRKGAVKVTVSGTDEVTSSDSRLPAECWITPEGKMYFIQHFSNSSFSISTTTVWYLAYGEFVCSPDYVFPFDTLVNIME
ncbi:MAG: hypothetical protein J5824_00100 [Lachnospiraceae bacterium]|nr:hypothetical protein [Lachnospiraceae bacterium]